MENVRFRYFNNTRPDKKLGMDYNHLDIFVNLLKMNDLKIQNDTFNFIIEDLSARDKCGFVLDHRAVGRRDKFSVSHAAHHRDIDRYGSQSCHNFACCSGYVAGKTAVASRAVYALCRRLAAKRATQADVCGRSLVHRARSHADRRRR